MNTKCGLRGSIIPIDALGDLSEHFFHDPFEVEIKDGIIEVGFDEESLTEQARTTVEQYLGVMGFSRDRKISIDLNMGWRQNEQGGKDIQLSPHEAIRVTTEMQAVTMTATISGKASIVRMDSRSLMQYKELVRKTQKDATLNSAIRYYNEEVVSDDKPLYGIYKALEALTDTLGRDGRAALAKIAGENKKYVDDVMQTAQITRHHADPNARQVLTDLECKDRARTLIRAYAGTVDSM